MCERIGKPDACVTRGFSYDQLQQVLTQLVSRRESRGLLSSCSNPSMMDSSLRKEPRRPEQHADFVCEKFVRIVFAPGYRGKGFHRLASGLPLGRGYSERASMQQLNAIGWSRWSGNQCPDRECDFPFDKRSSRRNAWSWPNPCQQSDRCYWRGTRRSPEFLWICAFGAIYKAGNACVADLSGARRRHAIAGLRNRLCLGMILGKEMRWPRSYRPSSNYSWCICFTDPRIRHRKGKRGIKETDDPCVKIIRMTVAQFDANAVQDSQAAELTLIRTRRVLHADEIARSLRRVLEILTKFYDDDVE